MKRPTANRTLTQATLEIRSQQGNYRIRPIVILAACILLSFIAYSLMLRMHYSPDSYGHIYKSAKDLLFGHLSGGRIVSGVISYILAVLGYQNVLNQTFGVTYLILCVAISAFLLIYQVIKRSNNVDFRFLITVFSVISISFINVFYLELFMFPEATIIFGTGTILSVAAVIVLDNKQTIFGLILSLVLLTVAVNIYQIFIELYVLYAVIFILIESDLDCKKKTVLKVIAVLAVALISAFVSFFLTSALCSLLGVAQNPRSATFDLSIILTNIGRIADYQVILWSKGSGLLPYMSLALFGGVTFLTLLAGIIQTRKKSPLNIAFWIILIFGCYILCFAPHFISKSFWPAQRTMFVFFSIFALVIILISLLTDKRIIRNILLAISVLLLSLNIFQIQQLSTDGSIKDALDKETAYEVEYAIEKHEAETGVTINNIRYAHGSYNYGNFSYNKRPSFDFNLTARAVSWAVPQFINYYTGRNFSAAPIDDEHFNKYYNGRYWDAFNAEEQMFFEGDTLYIFFY